MLAEKWGVPPWTIEKEASKYWVENAVTYYNVISEAQEKVNKKANRGLGTAETGHEGMKAGPPIGGTFDVSEMSNLVWPD